MFSADQHSSRGVAFTASVGHHDELRRQVNVAAIFLNYKTSTDRCFCKAAIAKAAPAGTEDETRAA